MSLLEKINDATQSSQKNELQLLVFKVSTQEETPFYAINVFKTREVVEAKRHHLTLIPGAHPMLEGTITLRGTQIPVLNLPHWLNNSLTHEEIQQSDILICDFNGIIIGLRIMFAYRVIKKNWSEMHAPDSYNVKDQGMVMNDTRLEDGSLCLILDYEKFLSEVIPMAMVDPSESPENIKSLELPEKLLKGTVLIAEDSKTAQHHLKKLFENAKLQYKIFSNGKQLIKHIYNLPDASVIPAIVTDIEMPEVSGFTVIKTLKNDPLKKDIPIIVNSSMTGDNNKREAEQLGANGFINKTKSHDLLPLIIEVMQQ